MYLDYVEADVLVEGKESNNSQTVVVPHSMHQEKLNQEPKLREWGMGKAVKNYKDMLTLASTCT